jgi:hypothetical protein
MIKYREFVIIIFKTKRFIQMKVYKDIGLSSEDIDYNDEFCLYASPKLTHKNRDYVERDCIRFIEQEDNKEILKRIFYKIKTLEFDKKKNLSLFNDITSIECKLSIYNIKD